MRYFVLAARTIFYCEIFSWVVLQKEDFNPSLKLTENN